MILSMILGRELMRRFIEEADRGQSTLLPECLDDFVDEGNPVRVIDVFVDTLDLAEMGFDGVDPAATGRAVVPSFGAPEALYLRLSKPDSVEPAVGARGRPQCRGDVVAGPARA
jgi:hypothetical protein